MNFGKRLKNGTHFITTTKKMCKDRSRNQFNNYGTYEVLRPGDQRYFTKGKRRYFCAVVYMIEFRTGLFPGPGPGGPRWYMFSYKVKILEG